MRPLWNRYVLCVVLRARSFIHQQKQKARKQREKGFIHKSWVMATLSGHVWNQNGPWRLTVISVSPFSFRIWLSFFCSSDLSSSNHRHSGLLLIRNLQKSSGLLSVQLVSSDPSCSVSSMPLHELQLIVMHMKTLLIHAFWSIDWIAETEFY